MQLTEHKPGDHHVIREIREGVVRIDREEYTTSLILGARYLETAWPVTGLDDLDGPALEPLLAPEPEVVIIGVGERQQILAPSVQIEFVKRGIGVECMTLSAAARTFNVLMSENRRALAGLIQPRSNPAA